MSVLKAVCGFAAAVGLASRLYQSEAEAHDARRYPPPGRLVDIGGRRLHAWIAGRGGPSVVVMPCLGGTGVSWAPVLDGLADTTTVCLVDRAGLGWSDSGPWPRTGTAMADELHQLVRAAEIPTPFVLVGHSTGGLISRVYAARYGSDLAGMVLVDATPPDLDTRLPSGGRRRWVGDARTIRELLTPSGLDRAAQTLGVTDGARGYAQRFLPADQVEPATANMLTRRHRRADAQEMLGLRGLKTQVLAENHHLGALPLTVLVGGPRSRESWHPAWLELQRELCDLSTTSAYVYAEHTGHHVHHDDPALVVQSIRELLDRIRSQHPTEGPVDQESEQPKPSRKPPPGRRR